MAGGGGWVVRIWLSALADAQDQTRAWCLHPLVPTGMNTVPFRKRLRRRQGKIRLIFARLGANWLERTRREGKREQPLIFRLCSGQKKRPPLSTGAKLPWFSLLRELRWRPSPGGRRGGKRH